MKKNNSHSILKDISTKAERALVAVLCCIFILTANARADFDEAQLPSQDGDLGEVDGWLVERHTDGKWTPVKESVEFSQDGDGKGVFLWKKNAKGETQARVVKTFPATTSDKVLVRFSIKPGAEELGGRLFFTKDVGEDKLLALKLQKGRLHFLERGRKTDTDTGLSFNPNKFNKVEIQITLSEGKAKVLLNGEDAGEYEIRENQPNVGTMILFAGGEGHETAIKDLSVLSVTDFDQQ